MPATRLATRNCVRLQNRRPGVRVPPPLLYRAIAPRTTTLPGSGAPHVHREPLLEPRHDLVFLARDIGIRFARDGIHVLDQIGTLRPRRDRDTGRRIDSWSVDGREVEHEAGVPAHLDVAPALRPREALGVSFPHLADQLPVTELARPA